MQREMLDIYAPQGPLNTAGLPVAGDPSISAALPCSGLTSLPRRLEDKLDGYAQGAVAWLRQAARWRGPVNQVGARLRLDAHKPRSVLFLQGPAGTTFERIGLALLARGHLVLRVNFNLGDELFWRIPGAIRFRSRASAWPGFLESLLRRSGTTDIVLFGDCRPLHRAAIEVAKRNGVPVHVLEEGYLRPHWVTLERDGVNGHSSLPVDPDWYLRQPFVPVRPLEMDQPYSFARRAVEDVAYNLVRLAGWPLYPFYVGHRPWHPLLEYAGWIGRLLGQKAERGRAAAAVAKLDADARPYFIFPLQLDCDFQIRVHSPFRALRPALKQVIASFAQHAPHDAMLVIKQHPLENGLRNWRRVIAEIAKPLGIADRIVFLEAGDLCALLKRASGMVTINSTSGMDALAASVPLIALGTAVYDIAGLTNGKDLDRFWQCGRKPRPDLLAAFRSVLLQRCLIPGGFYSAAGIGAVAMGVVERLEAQPESVARQAAPIAVLTAEWERQACE